MLARFNTKFMYKSINKSEPKNVPSTSKKVPKVSSSLKESEEAESLDMVLNLFAGEDFDDDDNYCDL